MQDKIRQLVEEELTRANEKFPGFASAHEGYAVLLEEVEEAETELSHIKFDLGVLWGHTKDNDIFYMQPSEAVKEIYQDAMYLAAEAIQVAAMARKFEQFLERSNGDGEGKV